MTQPLTPAAAAPGTEPAATLWKPVLLRSAAALVFGAVTIFWPAPSVEVMGWSGGLYLLATGLIALRGIPATGFQRDSAVGKMLSAGGSVLTGTGFALVLLHGDLFFGVIAALSVFTTLPWLTAPMAAPDCGTLPGLKATFVPNCPPLF